MEFTTDIEKRNFRCQVIEGILYVSSGGFLSFQIVYPSLVRSLGGGNLAIGAIPVLVYMPFLLVQLCSANFYRNHPYKKRLVINIGLWQRTQILLMGIVVGVFGKEFPSIALILFLMFLTLNQVIGGWVSPVWFDFFTKLTRPFNRGRLIGIRSSGGALLGFANGMILTAMLAGIPFPYNFAFAFLLASMFQYSSSYIQNKLIEVEPIETEKPLKSIGLFFKVVAIIKNDSLFRKFLISSAFSVIGFIPVSFFTVTAMLRLSLESSAVGFFAVIAIAGQVLSSAILGLLADKKGYKVVLIICSTSLIVATLFVLFGYHLIFFYAAFFLSGVTIGADLIMRYNFTADCTDEVNRAIYVGLMNAILAPFYLSGLLAGILSDFWGYEAVFIAGLFFNLLGVLILFSVPEPRKLHSTRLALSSK